jgi:AraC-like DNA-binding protein
MNELERTHNELQSTHPSKTVNKLTTLEAYDQFASMAYGIILQIIPQTHIAQEILVSVFSSPLLKSCNSYPFTFAVCVIKLARSKAVEAKRKMGELFPYNEDHKATADKSPEAIFDLSFRQGYTPDEVAERLQISKSDVLRAFHEFFKSPRNA